MQQAHFILHITSIAAWHYTDISIRKQTQTQASAVSHTHREVYDPIICSVLSVLSECCPNLVARWRQAMCCFLEIKNKRSKPHAHLWGSLQFYILKSKRMLKISQFQLVTQISNTCCLFDWLMFEVQSGQSAHGTQATGILQKDLNLF